jgi:c-di-GMP-binding flagellar brake protein YcgR
MSQERRRHVRVKPTADAPARAVTPAEGLVREVVDVIDISVGGLALSAGGPLARARVEQRLDFSLDLGRWGAHRLAAVVRWASPNIVGVEFADVSADAAQALSRYVSELLARGSAS